MFWKPQVCLCTANLPTDSDSFCFWLIAPFYPLLSVVYFLQFKSAAISSSNWRHTNYSEWGKCWLFCAVNCFSIVFLPHFPWLWVKRMRLASTLQKQMLQKCRKWKHWGVVIINGSVERSASITVLFAHIRGNAITSTLGWDRNSS